MMVTVTLTPAGFKYELALCLRGTADIPDMTQEEAAAFAQFRTAGQPKTFFNYLLLSPCKPVQDFRGFVEAVFYIGKGKNSRSLQHLREARGKSGKVCDIHNGPATTVPHRLLALYYRLHRKWPRFRRYGKLEGVSCPSMFSTTHPPVRHSVEKQP